MLDYEEQEKAIDIIKRAIEIVKQVHDCAEVKHDTYGEFYMDSVQYEIMQKTDALISEMIAIITAFKEVNDMGVDA